MASAQCQIIDGKPTSCTPADSNNSGMFLGSENDLGTAIGIGSNWQGGFGWDTTEVGVLKPQNNYNVLNFKFDDKRTDITGNKNIGNSTTYDITIGTNTNKVFLLNAGTNTLKSSLDVGMSNDIHYYLNAGELQGNLTLNGGGNFIANLTGGIIGNIAVTSSNATFNFTSPSSAKTPKPITLEGTINNNSGTLNLNFSNAVAEIKKEISGTNIKLDSTNGATTLTLNSPNFGITTFTAVGETGANNNKLTIGTGVNGTINIQNLELGDSKNQKAGLLTIDNQATSGVLTIANFKSKYTGSKLTISAGEIAITSAIAGDHNNITLSGTSNQAKLTLKGAGSNAINTFTALGGTDVGDNTLAISTGATATIGNLELGSGNAKGLLTITNSGNALKITNLKANAKDSALTLSGAYEAIGTLALANEASLNLDASGVTDNTNTPLTITDFSNTGTATLNLTKGNVTIAKQITAGSNVSNTFEIGDGNANATLKLEGGFLTNGGTNVFVINKGGTLELHNDQLRDGLITKSGTTSFKINKEALFKLPNKPIIAEQSGKNIIDTAVSFDLGEIKANGGRNDIILRGTAGGTNMAVGAISGNGTNNFTLDSSAGATTTLNLNGAENAINTFTALGNQNTLTLNSNTATADKNTIANLVLGDTTGGGKVGLLTIENNAKDASQKPIALTIDTFESKATGSTLTISGAGEVKIKNALKNTADINFTLNSATLTLDNANGDSTIANLTTTGTNNINFASNTTTITSGITAGQNVKNNISLGEDATLASVITANGASAENTITLANNSNITKDITATNGTNTITLTGKSATIDGDLIQTSGANKISFDSQLESQTLTLQGNTNTITTLTLSGQGNTINLAGDKDKINSRTNEFRLLTIGTSTPNTDTGLLNPNGATLTFESYINPKADQTKATLGEVPSQGDGKGKYGYAYSDRVIIHNAGNNTGQGQGQGKYKFKAHYSNSISENDLKSINYTKDKGTEQEGNIALFTIAKVNDGSNQGIIEFDTQDNNNSQIKSTTRAGLDAITTTLIKVSTNEYGKTVDDNGNVLGEDKKDYFTYFVDKIQQGSVISDEGRNIARDANLMIQSMAVSAVNLYLANFNSLNKRMGELRDNAYSKGVWARTFIGSQSNELGLSDQMGYFSIQAGFDGALKREKANNFIGFAISYSKNFGYSSTKNNARSLNSGVRAPELGIDSLNSQLLELALYNSYVADSGWYNDTIGKFSYIQNSMTVKDQNKSNGINGAVGEFNTFALTLSNEVGYRAKLGEDKAWFIDPQAELAIGHINGVNFSLNHYNINQANATISSAINLRARAGASIGYDFKNFTQDKGIDAKVYVGAFYEMDYFHYTDGSQGIKYTTKLKDLREVKMLDTDHRAVLNVGTNLTIKDATRIYLDFEKSFGGKITTDYKINAGVRYSFGEALSEKGKEVLKDKEGESVDSETKAPLKLEKGDK